MGRNTLVGIILILAGTVCLFASLGAVIWLRRLGMEAALAHITFYQSEQEKIIPFFIMAVGTGMVGVGVLLSLWRR